MPLRNNTNGAPDWRPSLRNFPPVGLAQQTNLAHTLPCSGKAPSNAAPTPNVNANAEPPARNTTGLPAFATPAQQSQPAKPTIASEPGQQGVTHKGFTLPATHRVRGGGDASASSGEAANAGPNAMRKHCVSSYFTDGEYETLKAAAKGNHRRMGAVLRHSFLSGPAVAVPEPNREKWAELAHALSNLNQLTTKINIGKLTEDLRPVLAELLEQIHALRADMLGNKHPVKRRKQ